jgi:hypothetical protein
LGEAWVNERGWRLMDFIAPESFTYWLSILFLVGSVFGGMTSVWGRRGRGTVPPVLARHRRHGVTRPRPSGVRGAPGALDAVHAEWRRRSDVGVAMASDMGHAGAALTRAFNQWAELKQQGHRGISPKPLPPLAGARFGRPANTSIAFRIEGRT